MALRTAGAPESLLGSHVRRGAACGLGCLATFIVFSLVPPARAQSAPPGAPRAATAAAPHAAGRTIPCTCRAAGRDYQLGEMVCLTTNGGPRLAICAMELNNTSWRVSRDPCPDS